MIDRNAVLEHLDRYMHIDAGLPPLIDMVSSHFCLADAQMCVFASSEDWLIVFEWIGYSPNADEFRGDLYVYGSMFDMPENGDTQEREQPAGTGFMLGSGLVHSPNHFEISGCEQQDVLLKLPPPHEDVEYYDIYFTYPAGYASVQTPLWAR